MTNAGVLGFEDDVPTGRDQHRHEHELWLAMQAAHDRWMNARAVLDDLIAFASDEVPSPHESLGIAKGAEEQRIGFEEYIEARLAFSEFLFTRGSGNGTGTAQASNQGLDEADSEAARTTSKRAILALAVALLCPVVLAVTYLTHERKHVRDLDAARDAMSAMLRQTPAVRSDAGNPPIQVAVTKPEAKAPVAPAPPRKVPALVKAAPAPAARGHWRRVQTPHQPLVPAGQGVPRQNHEFTLTPSKGYTQIGPVKVSLHNLDPKRGSFDVSVMRGNLRLEKKHVRRYEQVWINLGGSAPPVRLIADRIGNTSVHGYLGSPELKPAQSPSQRGKSLAELRVARQPHGD